MGKPLHTVRLTKVFLSAAKHVGMSAAEVQALEDELAKDPEQGELVQGSGGIRKVRFAGRGKGKSGGYRVMTVYLGPDYPVTVIGVLSKGDRANFTKAEIEQLRRIIEAEKQKRKGK